MSPTEELELLRYACGVLSPLCPGELLSFWGSMVFRHTPIPQKGSGKNKCEAGHRAVQEKRL